MQRKDFQLIGVTSAFIVTFFISNHQSIYKNTKCAEYTKGNVLYFNNKYTKEVINERRDHRIVDFILFICKMGWKVTFLATPPKHDFITLYDQPIKHHKHIEKGSLMKILIRWCSCNSSIVTRTTCAKRVCWRNFLVEKKTHSVGFSFLQFIPKFTFFLHFSAVL